MLGVAWCDPIMWSGGVTPTTARLRVEVSVATNEVVVSDSSDFQNVVFSKSVVQGVAAVEVTGLAEDTKYYYALSSNKALFGTFKTHKSGAFSYKVVFGSCALTGYESEVFTSVANEDALFFIHMGDLHYEDIDTNDTATRAESFRNVFASETQAAMFRSTPTVYMWDDHDYGPNNADGNFMGKSTARVAYQQNVPHYPLAAGSGNVPLQQAFTVGRVRYIMTDLRSASALPQSPNSTMGYPQRAWFLNELSQFANYGLVVWVNTKPWMGPPEEGVDRWPGYSEEREYIANQIKAMGVNNLVSLSGDAHLMGIDDGSHMDYATGGGAGFPVFHAAPLAQYGSVKDVGPFTQGCASYRMYITHQYGTMHVEDSGTSICLNWQGWRLGEADPMFAYSTCAPTMKSGVPGGSACKIAFMPGEMFVLAGMMTVAALFLGVCVCCQRRRAKALATAVQTGFARDADAESPLSHVERATAAAASLSSAGGGSDNGRGGRKRATQGRSGSPHLTRVHKVTQNPLTSVAPTDSPGAR